MTICLYEYIYEYIAQTPKPSNRSSTTVTAYRLVVYNIFMRLSSLIMSHCGTARYFQFANNFYFDTYLKMNLEVLSKIHNFQYLYITRVYLQVK